MPRPANPTAYWRLFPKEYMRAKNAERRARCKAAGICVDCSAPAITTRCPECASIQRDKTNHLRAERRAFTH